jgi:hypothetical protein
MAATAFAMQKIVCSRRVSQTDPKLRQDYLIITACWVKLSRELSELPADFSKPERQGQQKEGMEEKTSLAL